MSWNGTMLPVCPNMVGGILLFPKSLEEDAGHIYEMSDNLPVAYASNNVKYYSQRRQGEPEPDGEQGFGKRVQVCLGIYT